MSPKAKQTDLVSLSLRCRQSAGLLREHDSTRLTWWKKSSMKCSFSTTTKLGGSSSLVLHCKKTKSGISVTLGFHRQEQLQLTASVLQPPQHSMH